VRIGFDVTPLSVTRTGVGSYTASVYRTLRESGDDEIIPLCHRRLHPSFARELGHLLCFDDASADRSAGWRASTTIWMQAVLPRQLRHARLDVCHFTNNVAPLSNPCPTVVTIHDAGLWRHPEFHYRRRLLTMRALIPRVARQAAAIITPSHSAKADLLDVLDVPGEKVHVIYPGVSASFRPLPPSAERERLRRERDLPERFVLVVGAIEPRKNLVRLLNAVVLLRSEAAFRDLGLVLVGPLGWKYAPVQATMARLASTVPIRFVGHVADEVLVSLYNLASVLAFPSLYEGFGLPLVEAMACGTPIVTSRGGALAEVAGSAAELVEPTDVESIAAGLRVILDDAVRAAELRTRGLARAKHFAWESTARGTRAVYATVASEGR
jgi:glycosyltransferase involved in cell wall biosynthesis